MARRRSRRDENSIFIILMDLPWQVSAVFAFIVFALLRWIFPMQATSPLLAPLGKVAYSYAPFVSLLFLLPGLVSFFRNGSRGTSVISETHIPRSVRSSAPHISSPMQHKSVDERESLNSSLPKINEWSISLLRSLEWKRFEMLCAEYFKVLGKRVETVTHGADGGIDVRVYKGESDVIESFIQCKSWSKMVGVAPVRELFGVMAHESTGKGIFMTTSTFSDDAQQFAMSHRDKLRSRKRHRLSKVSL